MNVYILLNKEKVLCGEFTCHHDSKEFVFTYNSSYLSLPNSISLDPFSLPLLKESFYSFPAVFADALPGAFYRWLLEAQQGHIEDFDILSMLKYPFYPFISFSENTEEIIPTMHNIKDIYDAFCHINERGISSMDFSALPALGGMRPKVVVQKESELYIAKFSEKDDKYNNPRIEYATMNLAQNCGLYVAEHNIINYESHDVYLTKMFDKEYHNGKFYSKGLLTGLSCMQITAKGYGSFSYLKMAQNTHSKQEIFKRIIFNILIRNTDDHPRNHSFHYDLSISPCYDLVPSASKKGINTNFSLACILGNHGKQASHENLLSCLDIFEIEDIKTIIYPMSHAFSDWEKTFIKANVSLQDRKIFRNTFEQGNIFLEEILNR